MRRIEIPTPPGRPESAHIVLPLKGPWVELSQHEAFDSSLSFEDLMFVHRDKINTTFDLRLGFVLYQSDGIGGITIAGAYYDTSD